MFGRESTSCKASGCKMAEKDWTVENFCGLCIILLLESDNYQQMLKMVMESVGGIRRFLAGALTLTVMAM